MAKAYLPLLTPEKSARRDIDDNGDLLVWHVGKSGVERRSLVQTIAKPSWLDPKTRGPK